ncbi:MAG: FKBP-type peptidyl-prolyl cis-trans isomerase N-terminal domain-containing protein [Chlamydiota bacterium]
MRNFIFMFLIVSSGFCEEEKLDSNLDVAKISEAMGHLIGKNLQELGLNIELSAVIKGMLDASSGKDSPLNEEECVQAIASLQDENLSQTSEKNLEAAETFLEKNGKIQGISSLEEGKIQYQIAKSGTGNAVQSYNSPLVRYTGHYLGGQTLGTSEGGDEILLLDETIPGFKKGIVGMKEGEVRTLFIHPDLGYGSSGLNPNALLIFEVEVIKADASSEAHAASNKEILPEPLGKSLPDGESLKPR